MSAFAVYAEGLGKWYSGGRRRRAHERLERFIRRPFHALLGTADPAASQGTWAVRGVSFHVPAGEVVALVGGNGAGKSVLLKILSHVTWPTEGTAQVRGRLGSLLDVVSGFHPELTGRENVYLHGVILGMNRSEISRKFDEIVAFSEVEQHLDKEVKHYSAGMRMRLAFAVAAHMDCDVVLLDEVFAVADQSFQEKCTAKVRQVAHNGGSVILVSHDANAVESLCSRAILLEGGRLIADGPAPVVMEQYQARRRTSKA